MDDLIVSMALAVILRVVKNPAKKEDMRKALLKVRNAINMAYVGDPEFTE